MAEISLASFNIHGGIDGWGRPFDVVAACATVDTDILVLQESWGPTGGASSASMVGAALGYQVVEHPLASGRRAGPNPAAGSTWMRPFDWRGTGHALFLDDKRTLPTRIRDSERYRAGEEGEWSLAVLSRIPVLSHRFVALPDLRRDVSKRGFYLLALEGLTVAGTHMSHLSYGSPAHFRQLAQFLDTEVTGPAALAGDMNLWGPPARAFFRGWRRAVRGRTWPAWRPHSQLDHILVREQVEVRDARVIPLMVSDHRPVAATLSVR